MKKANKKSLSFKKSSIMELDLDSMRGVVGGATTNTIGQDQTTIICGDCVPVPSTIRNLTKLQQVQ